MINWPVAFGLTLVSEALVLYLLFRKNTPVMNIAAALLVGNALTHPVVWFMIPRLVSSYGAYIGIAETFAFAVEVTVILVLIRPEPWYMSIAGSALANGVSYLVGLSFLHLSG